MVSIHLFWNKLAWVLLVQFHLFICSWIIRSIKLFRKLSNKPVQFDTNNSLSMNKSITRFVFLVLKYLLLNKAGQLSCSGSCFNLFEQACAIWYKQLSWSMNKSITRFVFSVLKYLLLNKAGHSCIMCPNLTMDTRYAWCLLVAWWCKQDQVNMKNTICDMNNAQLRLLRNKSIDRTQLETNPMKQIHSTCSGTTHTDRNKALFRNKWMHETQLILFRNKSIEFSWGYSGTMNWSNSAQLVSEQSNW
jgi:hypothetical protein